MTQKPAACSRSCGFVTASSRDRLPTTGHSHTARLWSGFAIGRARATANMATIYTHAVVGLGLAQLYTPHRRRWAYWTLAAALAVIPDLDSFSSAAYGSLLGH